MIVQHAYPKLSNIHLINNALIKLLLPLSSKQVYRTVVNEAVAMVQAFGGSIFLYDDHKRMFVRAYSNVPEAQRFQPRSQGNTYWVYTHNKIRVVTAEELRRDHPEADSIIHSVLLLPLTIGEKAIGVLSIKFSADKPFTKDHSDTLQLFSSVASLAIRNAHLHEQRQKALEMKELFLSIASHEVRTPLTAIKAYSQLMKKSHYITEMEAKSVQAILRNVDSIIEMMNGLFLVSEMSAGTFAIHKQDLNLSSLIAQTIEDIQISTGRKIAYISDQEQTPYVGDEIRLTSVITNVVRNAILYAGASAEIKVQLFTKKKFYLIYIIDTGMGIKKEYLKHLKEKYYRPKQNQRGLGIGLFVSSSIIKAHKGTLKISSKEGKGTTVTINLPRFS